MDSIQLADLRLGNIALINKFGHSRDKISLRPVSSQLISLWAD
jgi:hypothetical protein